MGCPRCTWPLEPLAKGAVEVDHCARCGGNFFEKGEAEEAFPELAHWESLPTARRAGTSRLACPHDGSRFFVYRVRSAGDEVEVDVCPSCEGIWLDRDEGRRLRTIVATARHASARSPGVASYFFQLFTGLPIEVWNPVRTTPVVVWGLAIAMIGVFLVQMLLGSRHGVEGAMEILRPFTLVPSDFLHGHGIAGLLTHAFLHGNAVHLLGNLYFLVIFGDNVEDLLGHARFAALFLLSLLAGALVQVAATPASTMPMVGASGAVSGILGAYLLLFPRVQVWTVFFFIRFRLGIGIYFALWVLLQVAYAAMGMEGIAWYAHFGGFAAGLVLGPALARRGVPLPADHEHGRQRGVSPEVRRGG